MTKYTDEQIAQAMHAAAAENTAPPVYASGFGAYKKVIDALPDVPHCGDCAVDRAKAGVYEQLLDHPFFEGWSEAEELVADYMTARLNEAHKNEQTYPQMELDDVRKGDRVIIHTTRGSAYEVTVIKRDEYAITWEKSSVSNRYIDRIYLMDRPVQHPDPAEHPVILVRDSKYTGPFLDPIVMTLFSGTYVGNNYQLQPESITDWSPAKVVADDDR